LILKSNGKNSNVCGVVGTNKRAFATVIAPLFYTQISFIQKLLETKSAIKRKSAGKWLEKRYPKCQIIGCTGLVG